MSSNPLVTALAGSAGRSHLLTCTQGPNVCISDFVGNVQGDYYCSSPSPTLQWIHYCFKRAGRVSARYLRQPSCIAPQHAKWTVGSKSGRRRG